MRTIVVGKISTQAGISSINVWYRFPIVGAARQVVYAGSFAPAAPGDYTGVDQPEISLFQSGAWIERAGFVDVLDPSSTVAQIQTRLVNIYNVAKAASKAVDDAALADWGSSFDGTTWTMKTA